MRLRWDGIVYLVADPSITRGRDLVPLIVRAVHGGVSFVQLRGKDLATRAFVEAGRAVAAALAPLGVPFVVNDRVDVALACGADGVHVGQDDMAAADARRLLGDGAIIGLSVTSEADARALDPALVHYAGVGPIFATATKPDATPPLGLDGLARVCALLRVPVVAIGGIEAGNAESAVRAGAGGIAVVSAICAADDPDAAARMLVEAVRAARAVGAR